MLTQPASIIVTPAIVAIVCNLVVFTDGKLQLGFELLLTKRISQGAFDDIDNPLTEGTYTVECWSWHDTIPLRFEPDGDAPKFVPCAGAN